MCRKILLIFNRISRIFIFIQKTALNFSKYFVLFIDFINNLNNQFIMNK